MTRHAGGTARLWTRGLLVACAFVMLAQIALLVSLGHRRDPSPEQVPIVISAPALVAARLADDANAMPGAPFEATWTDDEDEARQRVDDGDAVLAVLVDLRTTEDVVVVDARGDADLNQAALARVRSVEKSWGRTARLEPVGDDGAGGSLGRIRWYVALCGLLGLAYSLVVSLVRGPMAATFGLGLLRVVGLGAWSIGVAALAQWVPALALPGNELAVVGIGALAGFTIGAFTLALESLFGLVGIVAAAAVTFVLATPLIVGTSPYLLPAPWPTITPWLPSGAATNALADVAFYDSDNAVRAVLVVVVSSVLSVLVLVLSRWLRRGDVSSLDSDAVRVRHWRTSIVGVIAALGLVMGMAVALVPTSVARTPFLPSRASETTCVKNARTVGSVTGLNDLISSLKGTPAFMGADVGADVQLKDGRYLLVFGDTVRSDDFDGPALARNSMMLWGEDCVSVVLPPSKGALIPDRADGVGYWPMSLGVAHRPGYDLVVVSAQRVQTTGGGSFDFANLGPALAVFIVQNGGTPQLISKDDIGPDDADTARPEWGAALASDKKWVYLYGTAREADATTPGFTLRVARVRAEQVLDSGRWRYWDGSAWRPDPERATSILPEADGVSQTLSVFSERSSEGKKWYALSKLGGDLGSQIALWSAPAPTGPFSLVGPVASVPTDTAAGQVTYMPLAHPDILPKPGTVVASYSRNNTDFATIEADPTLYRPEFLRISLPR